MKSTLKNLSRGDLATGAITGLIVACVIGLMADPVFGLGMGVIAALVASSGRQGQRAALQQRIDRPAAMVWEVMVNNVRVGQLSDATYARYEKAVHEDWRVYSAQLANLAKVCMRAGEMLLFAVPISLVWIVLAIIVIDPAAAASVVEALRAAPASELISAIERSMSVVMFIFAITMFMFAALASPRLGYVNQFTRELNDVVRRHVRVAAEGRMMLVPCQSPVPVNAA